MNLVSQADHKAITAFRKVSIQEGTGKVLKFALITYRDYYKSFTRIKKIGFWSQAASEDMQTLLNSLELVEDVDYVFDSHTLIYHVAK